MFKIINDTAIHMEQPQIDYLFGEILKTEPNKLGLEEFNALSEFGKWSKKDSGDF